MFNSGTFCAPAEELSTEAMLAYSDELAESRAFFEPFEARAPLFGMGIGPERGPVSAYASGAGACCGRLFARFVVSCSESAASAFAGSSTTWLWFWFWFCDEPFA